MLLEGCAVAKPFDYGLVLLLSCKFQQFNRCTVIENHGHCDPFAGAIRRYQNFSTFKGRLEIVQLERNVGNGFNNLRKRCIWIESHPRNAARTGFETSDVDPEPGNMNLIRTRRIGGDSNMVITPAMACDYGRKLITSAD